MVDKDGDTQGRWKRNGPTITMDFGKTIVYDGTLQGDAIRGVGKNAARTWTFSVSNSNALTGATASLQQARTLLDDGKIDEALVKLDDAVRAEPKGALAYSWRAFAHYKKNAFEKALADCDTAIRLNPQVSNAFNVRGIVLLAQGELDEAIKELTRAVSLSPKDSNTYANRGRTYAAKKNYDDAINDYNTALGLKATSAVTLVSRGLAYMHKNSYERAINDFSEAIRLQPTRAVNHNYRGLAYFRSERFDEAIADTTEAIRLDTRFAFAYTNRGAAYFKKKLYDQALKDVTEAIRIDPKTDGAFFWRSQIYAKLGNNELAKADYEKSIQLNPANQQLRIDVDFAGRAYTPVANRQEALRALRAFQLGSTLPSDRLYEINNLAQYEPAEKLLNPLPKEVQDLIRFEKQRFEQLELEMVAAADRFLNAAKASAAARQAEGVELQWLYGPVTSVADRIQSQDDLGGMRLIGRLILNDGKEITAIFPITFYPNIGADGKRGGPGILWGADNFRIVVKLFASGTAKRDYAHQSFSVSHKDDGSQNMKPGYNISQETGMLIDPYIRQSSLGTRCFDCHRKGTNLNIKGDNVNYVLMKNKDYRAMKGFDGFLKLATELGATRSDRDELEDSMKKDPSLLIPVDELLRANEDYWVKRYIDFKKRLANARLKLPQKSSNDPPRAIDPKDSRLLSEYHPFLWRTRRAYFARLDPDPWR